MRIAHFNSASEIVASKEAATLPRFDPADFEIHHGDLHLRALAEAGEIQARCSLWWKHTPTHKQHQVGILGHYSAVNDEAATALLLSAQEQLRAKGCTLAIGPMNGNTWRSYRFVTERGDQPSFFLEPAHPPEWPMQFNRAGFSPLASYFSALNSDLSRPDSRVAVIAQKIADAGVVIRKGIPDLRQELEKIYSVSRISFQNNFLYTEISQADFAAMYEPVLPIARPELVVLAERNGECVGYLFAIPDFAMKARGVEIDTFIIKTVSILPYPELRGLGTLLVARAQQIGYEIGYRRCIHALMFENNASLNISRHYATVMRKYTLYSKDLGSGDLAK
jgi:GNAT superfamily N-acetyltransferase